MRFIFILGSIMCHLTLKMCFDVKKKTNIRFLFVLDIVCFVDRSFFYKWSLQINLSFAFVKLHTSVGHMSSVRMSRSKTPVSVVIAYRPLQTSE